MPPREDPLLRLLRATHILSALSREVLEDGYLREAGTRISFVQLNLLKFLDQRGGRTIGDVMRFMGASFPAASKAVGRLKAKALVRVVRHPKDRRAQIVGLTRNGRSVIRKYESVKKARLRKLLAGMSPRRVEDWIRSLEEVSSTLLRDKVLDGDLCLQCGAYYSDSCLVRDRRCRVRSTPQ